MAKDHLARFVLGIVREHLDLAEITGTNGRAKGQPRYDPVMMTALYLYAYAAQPIHASRVNAIVRWSGPVR